MEIFADVAESADRLEELVEFARRGDEVLICAAMPLAELTALPTTTMREARACARADTTCPSYAHDGDTGLPR